MIQWDCWMKNGNKAWIPVKNVEKLRDLEVQEENKGKFLRRIS